MCPETWCLKVSLELGSWDLELLLRLRVDVLARRYLTAAMRFLIPLVICASLVAGCKTKSAKTANQANASEKSNATQPPKETITPVAGKIGKVAKVNAGAKFVVVKFPTGQVPAKDQRFNVYRAGLKVGEIKISDPPPVDNLAVADIIAGEAQFDDEVREN